MDGFCVAKSRSHAYARAMPALEGAISAPFDSSEETGVAEVSERPAGHAGAPQSIWRGIRRDMLVLGAGSAGTLLAQLAFRGILVAALLPASYGRLCLVLSVYNAAWIIGAGGLPSGVARHIAAASPAGDAAAVRSALRAAAWPASIAAVAVGGFAAAILHSPPAFALGGAGLCSFAYSMIIMGILRGRGRIGASSAIMPLGGIAEVVALLGLLASGLAISPISGFAVFCLGNIIGLAAAVHLLRRTAPSCAFDASPMEGSAATARRLLGLSLWLGVATVGIAVLPVVMRFGAALGSYSVVAIVDIALLLLSIPLRIGSVIVSAVVPRATRALATGERPLAISVREQVMVAAPFVAAAIVVGSTNLVARAFDALGRPQYAHGSVYLALALLAGPARVLYGLVEGMLVAHGEGRFLALNSIVVTVVASGAILLAAALGHLIAAFALFVAACWAVYLFGQRRLADLGRRRSGTPAYGTPVLSET